RGDVVDVLVLVGGRLGGDGGVLGLFAEVGDIGVLDADLAGVHVFLDQLRQRLAGEGRAERAPQVDPFGHDHRGVDVTDGLGVVGVAADELHVAARLLAGVRVGGLRR